MILPLLLTATLLQSVEPKGELIWFDEFEGDALQPSHWRAAEDCRGGGNNERQCYTRRPANVAVSDGLLRITARAEHTVGDCRADEGAAPPACAERAFSSGLVKTRGMASFRYGRIEVRARLPRGQGLWSAIWMLPEHDNYGPFPQSGEIDIAEAVNLGIDCAGCEDRIHGSVHHGPNTALNRQRTGSTLLSGPDEFHVFALDWTPERLTWLVDGEPYFATEAGPPFDQRFHLILNLAIGGPWAERNGRGGVDARVFPAELLVDWVRVYGRGP